MNEVFIICNQSGHFWGKSKSWVDGRDARAVMRLKHQDEAANTLFELSSKDVELRGEVVAAELSEKGEPMVEVSAIPLPVAAEENPDETASTDEEQVATADAADTPTAKDTPPGE